MMDANLIFQPIRHERVIKITVVVLLTVSLLIVLAQLLQTDLFMMLFVTEACRDIASSQAVGLEASVPPCWMVAH